MIRSVKIICLLLFSLPFIKVCSQSMIKEEFTLTTPGGLTLSGQMEYQKGHKQYPAAILLWGNGPHTRNQVISGTPMFEQVAAYLCQKGMAVMRMDKRGFGKSTGTFTAEGNYTTRDLADDVKLALAFLSKHPLIDTGRIGLIGHSEGSTLAAMVAAEEPGVDWLVCLGVQAVSGDAIVAEQKRLNRLQLGMSPQTSAAVGEVWKEYVTYLKSGHTNDSLYYAIGTRFLLAHGLKQDDNRITPAFINQLLDGYKASWFRYFISFNPADCFQKLRQPLLAVFGAHDKQTSVEQNLVPLHQALALSGNKNYRVVVLADEDHFFLRHQDQRLPKHKPGEMQVSGRLLRLCADWLQFQGILKE